MNDLRLDTSDHDLVIENGDLQLLNSEPLVALQSLKINLLFYQGEWFVDLDYGVPYFQSILKKGVSKTLVDSIMKQKIRSSYNILNIVKFRSEIINNEEYVINIFEATTTSGDIVSLSLIHI